MADVCAPLSNSVESPPNTADPAWLPSLSGDFRSPRARTLWTAGMLLALQACDAGHVAVYWATGNLLRSELEGIPIPDESWKTIATVDAGLATAAFGLHLAIVFAFCLWIYQVRSNLPALSNADFATSQRMVVAGFFIPIANFVLPYRAMQEIHRFSRPPNESWGGNSGSSRLSALVFCWWISFIAMNAAGSLSNFLAESAEQDESMESLMTSSYALAISSAISVSACGIAAYLVWRVGQNQLMRHQAIQAAIENSIE